MRHKLCFFATCFIVFSIAACTAELPMPNQGVIDETALFKSLTQVKRIWQDYTSKKKTPVETLQLLKAAEQEAPDSLKPFFRYLSVRVNIENGIEENLNELAHLIGTQGVAMDALRLMYALDYENRFVFFRCYGVLLPISNEGRHGSQCFARINPSRPRIPNIFINAPKMLEIAELFEKINMPQKAYLAYMEYFYRIIPAGWIKEPERNRINWLSASNYKTYVLIAKNAFAAGNDELAYIFLARAVLSYEDELAKYESINGIKTALLDMTEEANVLTEDDRKRYFRQILDHYLAVNMHPRVFMLMDEYTDLVDDVDVFKEKIRGEWLRLVDRSILECDRRVLFGQEVWPDGDPLTLTAPWPVSKESIAKVQEILKQELGLLKDE